MYFVHLVKFLFDYREQMYFFSLSAMTNEQKNVLNKVGVWQILPVHHSLITVLRLSMYAT